MRLQKDLREFVELLNSTNVNYLLVGGHAVAYHGFPRFTGDMDFFIERSAANGAALQKVLQQFGFGSLSVEPKDFLEAGNIIQLGRPPNRIDLITSIDGVEFHEAWATREQALIDGLVLPIISKELLLRNKRASQRPKDLEDLRQLGDE